MEKKHDYRTLQYNKYNQNVTITVPQNFGHQDLISDGAGMLGNGPDDTVFKGFQGAGCCTFQIEDTRPYYGIKKAAIQLP